MTSETVAVGVSGRGGGYTLLWFVFGLFFVCFVFSSYFCGVVFCLVGFCLNGKVILTCRSSSFRSVYLSICLSSSSLFIGKSQFWTDVR